MNVTEIIKSLREEPGEWWLAINVRHCIINDMTGFLNLKYGCYVYHGEDKTVSYSITDRLRLRYAICRWKRNHLADVRK